MRVYWCLVRSLLSLEVVMSYRASVRTGGWTLSISSHILASSYLSTHFSTSTHPSSSADLSSLPIWLCYTTMRIKISRRQKTCSLRSALLIISPQLIYFLSVCQSESQHQSVTTPRHLHSCIFYLSWLG